MSTRPSIPNLFVLILVATGLAACNVDRGIFDGESNVGRSRLGGDLVYERSADIYTVSGSGADIYDDHDEFYYVWRRASGDLALSADIEFANTSGHMFKKAGWMIRASLDDDSPYIDGLVHGDGLIAMQYREQKGGSTHGVLSGMRGPATLQLERTDSLYTLYLVRGRGELHVVGNVSLQLPDEVYIGLVVCSHDDSVQETASFTNVAVQEMGRPAERELESSIEVIDIGTGDRRIVRRTLAHLEAPNWSPDGESLVYNQEGKLYSIGVNSRIVRPIDTDFADRINNDHGFSPDGSMMAISHSPGDEGSVVYTMPAQGGTPTRITEHAPSYWHGWSPDGKMLAYVGRRDGEFDIYAIPSGGGEEIRLTSAPGLDDGPDYSPDGAYIYFNSVRTGSMKIWRMAPDGSNQEQMTFEREYADWFPHPSPDGRWIVFLSYDGDVEGHPANKPVTLRIMSAAGGEPLVLATLFGGQGTINVPSWSPDSQSLAFASYRLVGRN